MHYTKKRVTLSAALLLVSLALGACSDKLAPHSADSKSLAVETIRVSRGPVARLCEVPGTVVNKEQALVSARVMGTVSRADFAIGQGVVKGQELVQLSAPEMLARVDQAQAALDKARRDYERENSLFASGASTGQTVRELSERMRMAEAALVEAETYYSYTSVTAPFDGRITSKLTNVGDFAAPGTPLFEIAGKSGLRVEAGVPDSFPDSPNGTRMTIRTADAEYPAVLAEYSPAADPSSRTRLVKLDLAPGTDMRSGQFVRLLWPVGERTEILLPASAISQYGQISRVFVVRDGSAYMRIVKTGEHHADSLQVLSGIEDGDTVILNPPANLVNGQKLEVR